MTVSLAKAIVMLNDETLYDDGFFKKNLFTGATPNHIISYKYKSSSEMFFHLRRVHFDQRKQCMKGLACLHDFDLLESRKPLGIVFIKIYRIINSIMWQVQGLPGEICLL